MPILERTESRFTQVCAACGTSRTVPNAAVSVRERDDYAVLELPACACGAVEILLPSIGDTEHPRPGSDGHLHQLAVDELSTRVRGHSPTAQQADAIAHWLPEDVKLALPSLART